MIATHNGLTRRQVFLLFALVFLVAYSPAWLTMNNSWINCTVDANTMF